MRRVRTGRRRLGPTSDRGRRASGPVHEPDHEGLRGRRWGSRPRGGEADGHADEARQFCRGHGGDEGDAGDVGEVGKDHGSDVGLAGERPGADLGSMGPLLLPGVVGTLR